jgi:hypothetical protein
VAQGTVTGGGQGGRLAMSRVGDRRTEVAQLVVGELAQRLGPPSTKLRAERIERVVWHCEVFYPLTAAFVRGGRTGAWAGGIAA